ncbi:Arylsulfatase [Pontiella desulfatans]|uniref:Arylsulfatase n=1 Tax=Pontiella desulfatans TaxID=2750659 RepID=A0A6C2U797_PONDE|nr:sulfatase-like hydrolase/transferase [Pontiella desulfatans]SPS73994.1 sulfatase S1_16 [Kiritimatiellales bacterium]VGO15729.1 Arylsulfatase [Pontiella desulfatans]
MKKTVLLSLNVLGAVWAWASAPVGETVWLYHIDNASYITADAENDYAVTALGTSAIGDAQQFVIEDVDGTNIALKAFINGKYVQPRTADKDKLYAEATYTTNSLTHFLWSDLPSGKVRLTCVGDTDENANVSPGGASEILRSNTAETGSETEFSWGIVDGLLPIDSLVYSVNDESVTLDWDDDTSGTLDFYRVYRSSESGTNFVAIATNVAESTYADVGMPGGITYYYVVTRVDFSGVESGFSNEIAAVPNEVVRLQHLDAVNAASVLTSSGVVTQWIDQTIGGNHAVPGIGNTLYPSVSLSESGLPGVDMQSGRNSLELFSAGASDVWLDQSGGSNGFCVLVALKCDSVLAGGNDVLGNSGFGLGFSGAGDPQAWLGGQAVTSSSPWNVEGGDTLVLAFNYDDATGAYDFWESKSGTSTTGTLAAADFSTAEPVSLGSAASAARYLDGMVGEVKVFGSRLNPTHFKRQRNRLMGKWFNRPNIVLIYVDDWAWNGTPIRMDDRMRNSGMPSIMEMPNLESMAQNGMVFRNAYGSPQCTPARASIQTGQSNPRNGITVYMGNSGYYDDDSTTEGEKYYNFPVIANGSSRTFSPAAVTIPEALAPLGYACAHIGKWHIRDGSPGDEGYARHDGPTSNDEGNNYDDTTGLAGLEDPKLMTQITDDGIAFMEEQVAAGQPFYLQLSHYAMHGGWECSPESRARYQNHPDIVAYNGGEKNPEKINHTKDPAVFLGMAYELDLKIGEVRQKLVDLGIADNTYVIMMGDNGYRHDFFDELSGLSQPLHMQKWWLWQGGIRVPMVAEGPGIPAGSFTAANVANYDFLPTFVDWAGGDPARVPDLDGISLAGLMEGEAPGGDFLDRSLYFHFPHYRNTMPHSVMVKGQEAVVYFYETPVRFPAWEPIMYFDIGNDPGQYHNIYPENPARAGALYADMTNYFASVGARIPLVPNTNYVESVYMNVSEYDKRVAGGPFIGTRTAESDESGPTTFSEYWMDSWGVDIGSSTNDFDGDGTLNLAEYALGGNPTNALDPGAIPTFTRSEGGFNYTHMRRNDDSGLLYTIESTTNLVSGVWTNAGYTVDGIHATAGTFDSITNAIPVSDDDTFIRLRIDQQ